MEIFLKILHIISGPLVGAFIGWFTNWLAVKMLFKPYNPKYIGKWRIPFTPGVIPKRKADIAKGIGKVVEEDLVSSEDIKLVILKDLDTNKIVKSVLKDVSKKTNNIDKNEIKSKIVETLTEKIVEELGRLNVGDMVASKGVEYVKSSVKKPMILMFLSDDVLSNVSKTLSEKVNEELSVNGKRIIAEFIEKQVDELISKSPEDVVKSFGFDNQKLQEGITALFNEIVEKTLGGLFKNLQISKIVEEKINAMDTKEFEDLVLKVMKHELNTIVWLGALLGFLLGIITIFV